MKVKLLILFTSIIVTLVIGEIFTRMINQPKEMDPQYQRKDFYWMQQHVVLNAAGYRDKEYSQDRNDDSLRILTLGDSYTYGWLVDNVNDTYPKIIEAQLNKKLDKKVEVINAGYPGYSVSDDLTHFNSDGKFYNPDIVLLGINDSERNYLTNYTQPLDTNLPSWMKNMLYKSHLYEATLGAFFKAIADKDNNDRVLQAVSDPNSSGWIKLESQLVELQKESAKINAQLVILVYPHINPKKPNNPYDYYAYNKSFQDFGKQHGILIVDPLKEFLKDKQREDLVVNQFDAHPSPKMNAMIANEFVNQFPFQSFLASHTAYVPDIETIQVTNENKDLGKYELIRKITSSEPGLPWVYFELVNSASVQSFPVKDTTSRHTKVYVDKLQTAKTFTTTGVIGASLMYNMYPKKQGVIAVPKKLYGYPIVGINNIFAIYVRGVGEINSDYVAPSSVVDKGNYFLITFNPAHEYQAYRLNLNAAIRQMDIDENGHIANMIKTIPLESVVKKDTSTITFPITEKVSSTPQFMRAEGDMITYAFVDNQMVRVTGLEQNDKNIKLTFDRIIKKGQKVTFYIAANYKMPDSEIVNVEVER